MSYLTKLRVRLRTKRWDWRGTGRLFRLLGSDGPAWRDYELRLREAYVEGYREGWKDRKEEVKVVVTDCFNGMKECQGRSGYKSDRKAESENEDYRKTMDRLGGGWEDE